MFFLTSDNPAHPPCPGGRWLGPAALVAGGAALVILVLGVVLILRGDPQRAMLDEIDALMAGGQWQQAAAVCRRRMAERMGAKQAEAPGSKWTPGPDTDAELGLRLGVSLSMLQRFDEARSALDQALARRPKDARLGLNRALVDYREGRMDEALARLRQLAVDAPYAPNVHYHIGRIHEARGQYDAALQDYRDELNISSSAAAWQRYLVLKKMKGATTTQRSDADLH